MEPVHAARALAAASASMTTSRDVVGALNALLANCRDGLGVDAGGVLLFSGGRLELLVASSHRAAELETYQLLVDEGPCLEAFEGGTSVCEQGTERVVDRWPDFGPTMLEAGFQSVHAAPLAVHGTVFGAMGLFRSSATAFTVDEDKVAQAFADIAAMLIVHFGDVPPDQLSRQLQDALSVRMRIEQAKGVLADVHDVSMADAYDLLVRGAEENRQSLTSWANQVLHDAQTRHQR